MALLDRLKCEVLACDVHPVEFRRPLGLSGGRTITTVRERRLTVRVQDGTAEAIGTGALFDSTRWANPIESNPGARPTLDLDFLLTGSLALAGEMHNWDATSVFDLEGRLVGAAERFAAAFSHAHRYDVVALLPPMLISPVSQALWSAVEALLGQGDVLSAVSAGALRADFLAHRARHVPEIARTTIPELTPRGSSTIEWMMTADLAMSADSLRASLAQFGPRQVKLKVGPDARDALTPVLDTLAVWHHPLALYLDGNRSFDTLARFDEEVMTWISRRWPALRDRVIGCEEPVSDPFTCTPAEVRNLGVPIYLDESAVDVQAVRRMAPFGYGVVLKLSRPLGVLLLQLAVARHCGLPVCVQDLTCRANAYFAGLGIRAHIDSPLGFEANHNLYLADWTADLPAERRALTCVTDGRLATTRLSAGLFG